MNLPLRVSLLAAALALAGTALAAPQTAPQPARPGSQASSQAAPADEQPHARAHRHGMHAGHGGHGADGMRRMHGAGTLHGVHMAARLDADGDGRISKGEAGDGPLAAKFAQIDRNADGYLVRSEMRQFAEQRRAERQAERAQRSQARFAQADADGDGRLSRAEFEAAWPRMAQAFAFLDEDRDGHLLQADLAPPAR